MKQYFMHFYKTTGKYSYSKITILVFVISVLGNVCNYLLQLFAARFLSVEDYGLFNVGFSITFPFFLIISPVQNYITKVLSSNIAHNIENYSFYTFLKIKLYKIIGIYTLVPICLTFLIANFLDFDFSYSLIAVFFSIAVLPYFYDLSIIQSYHKIGLLAFSSFFAPFIKFTFCALAVYFTNSVFVAFISLLAGNFFLSLLFRYFTKDIIKIENSSKKYYIKDAILYIIKSSLVYCIYALLQYMDVMLVKYFCSLYDTGIYSSASVLGKAVIYLPSAMALILFPAVTEENAQGKSSFQLLIKSVGLNLFFSGGGALILFLSAKWIIPLFFGVKYMNAIPVIKYLGLAFMPLSMITIFFTFFLAKENFKCIFPMTLSVIVQFVLALFFHDTLLELVFTFFISGLAGCLGFLGIYLVGVIKRS
ncbi:MAG: hypothetical protein PUF61_14115 [Spirochaetales bacterium]|nr:hypothetical protein [Spirochaetales bacterium]